MKYRFLLFTLSFTMFGAQTHATTNQWTRQLGSTSDDESFGVSADGLGNIYISGVTFGSLGGMNAGGDDAFISKYDQAGDLQWTRQLGSTIGEGSLGVSADGLGNVYISGATFGSLGGTNAGASDAFISKYDQAGDLQWTRQFGSALSDFGNSVSSDGLGNVYVSGVIQDWSNPLSDSSAFISMYNQVGDLQWTNQFGPIVAFSQSQGISADGLGNVYFIGNTEVNSTDDDAFISKYNQAGDLQWTQLLGSAENKIAFDVSADGLGNVYISGSTDGDLGGPNAGGSDAFISKYNQAGDLQWTQQLGSVGNDAAYDVSADGLGNAYISGWTDGDLGGPNAGDSDTFISKYNQAGDLQWTQQLGSVGNDTTYDVSADGLGNAYISGWTDGNLGGPNAGGSDAFVARFSDPYTVINLPEDGNFGEDAAISSHTILNIGYGGFVGEDFTAYSGSIVNLYKGGYVDEEYDAEAGSVLNIYGGRIGEDFESNGAEVNLYGPDFFVNNEPLFDGVYTGPEYDEEVYEHTVYDLSERLLIPESLYEDLNGLLLDNSRFVFDDFFDEINYNDGMHLYVNRVIKAFLPGDYNIDGKVDAADYTVWREALGEPSGSLPNDMYTGVIGIDQYNVWRDHYGLSLVSMISGGAPAPAAVPEPSSALLLILAGVGVITGRIR